MACTSTEKLKPCPFCNGTNTEIRESVMWTGMQNQILSVSVMHWCDSKPYTSFVQLKAGTEEEAIKLWNTRNSIQHQ